MPAVKTRSVAELLTAYMPTQKDYEQAATPPFSTFNKSGFICECGKVCALKGNLNKHMLNCKFIKSKTEQEKEQTQQNDQQIIAELRAENSDLRAKILDMDNLRAKIAELQADKERLFSIAESKSAQSNNQQLPQIIYQQPIIPTKQSRTDKIMTFMNTKCDPISLDEFEKHGVTMDFENDMIALVRQGTIDGISNFMIKKLQQIPIINRPFHSITKRQVTQVYIRDNDKWIVDDHIFEKSINRFRSEMRDCILKTKKEMIENAEIIDQDTEEYVPAFSWSKKESREQSDLWDQFTPIQQTIRVSDDDMKKIIKKIVNFIDMKEEFIDGF
jgi:hypothetical protein